MSTYQITSSAGVDLGTYEGETAAHAIASMWRDAGYWTAHVTSDGEAEVGASGPDDCGIDESELTVREVVTVASVGGAR